MANEFKIKNGLVVSGSADVEQNLTVNGILTAKQYNVSLISSSILFESGSTQLGNSLDDTHLFTGSIKVTGSITLNGQPIGTGKLDETTFENYTSSTDSRLGLLENSTGSIRNDFNSFTSSYTNVSGSLDSRLDTLETLSGSFTGSFSGSFVGDGTNLFNIPASGVTGLNLTQIADGSVTASVSNTNGLRVNSKSEITGSLIVTNGITGSIDYSNITNKPTLVSGSSQIQITGTTGYSTFSSSISSSVGSLSSSIATTDFNQNTRLGLIETSTGSLNSFTSSALTRVGAIETFTSSALTRVSAIEIATGSLNSFTSSALTRLGLIETSTGSLNSFTSSALTRVSAIEIATGSLNSFTSSAQTKVNLIEISTASLNLFTSSELIRVGTIETSTASLNSFTSSALTRVGAIETSTGSLNSFTSSINTTIKTKLNTESVISGSVQVNITGTTGYSTFSSSVSSSIGSLSSSVATTTDNLSSSVSSSINSLSSSIAITDLNQTNRLGNIEVSTGSLNSFTSSINTTIKNKLNSDGVISGSSQISLGMVNGYTTFSSSLATTDFTQDGRLTSIESRTGSISALNMFTGSVSTFTSSVSSVTYSLQLATASLNSYTGSNNTVIGTLQTATSSLNSFTSSINTTIKNKLNSDGVISGSSQVLNGSGVWSGSAQLPSGIVSGSSQLPSGLVSGSSQVLNGTTIHSGAFFNGINVVSGSSQISFNGITDKPTLVSGSSQVDITSTTNYTSFSSSIATTDLNQNNRLDSIESKSGSYATTGSNVFKSSQTISGSVIITENLTVFGSSSITYVTSSQLRVDDNIITVNTASPGSRFGGLEVHDSGSVGIATGSILWDSVNNRWIYQQSSESTYGGGMLLSGPRSSGSLGSELSLTSGKIARSAGGDHLNDSIITEYGGTTIGISGNLEISGSLVIPSTPLVSGSSQISFNGITDKPTLVSGSSQVLNGSGVWSGSAQLPAGTVSGSSQVLSGTGIWSGSSQLPVGVVSGSSQVLLGTTIHSGTFFNGVSVVSGSGQIAFGGITGTPSGLVSGSSQVLLSSGIWSGSAQLPSGVVSGSSQVLLSSGVWSGSAQLPSGIVSGSSQLPSGLVSGSSQVLSGTGIHSGSFFNGVSVVSGSGQIAFGGITGVPSGLVSGSSQVLLSSGVWSGSAQLPSGVVSGSSQITYGSVSGVPSGLVSGSSQITFGSISSIPSGLVSGSSQVLSGTGIWSGSAQLPSGVVSGSSQITFGSISSIPSGLVSGSSQISLTATTGFGSYLNQAVLTSSSPTFSNVYGTTLQINGNGGTNDPYGTVSVSQPITSAYSYYGLTRNGNIGMGMGINLSNQFFIGATTAGATGAVLSGTAWVLLSSSVATFNGTLSASNFSGSSSGANTGDQTSVTGNAGTVTNGVYTTGAYSNPSWITSLAYSKISGVPAFITSYTETDTLATVTARGATTATETIFTGTLKTRKSQTAGDYTTAALWVESHSTTATGIAFHISGVKGTYLEMRTNQILYWDGNTVYHSGNLTNNNQLTNGAGYITGINSSAVTTALGYTPYNATNPNGYITSSATSLSLTGNLTVSSGNSTGGGIILADDGDIVDLNDAYLSLRFSSGVRIYSANRGGSAVITLGNTGVVTATTFSGALSGNATTATTAGALTSMNISQFTNNSNYITGISFANVSSKPTTISGYGITDAITTGNIGSQSVNYANSAGSAPNAGNANSFYNVSAGDGNGIKFWSSDSYKISMGVGSLYQYGPVTDYSIKMQMDVGSAGRGFTWGREGIAPIAGLNGTSGNMQIAGTFTTGGSILPLSNNSVNLGSVSLGWANVYTNDLHLSNMNKPEGNDVDGTKGTWTIQEGAENLYIINNNNGKKFKINLEEII